MFYDREVYLNLGTLDTSGANAIVFAPGEEADVQGLVFINTVAHTVADATLTVAVRDVDNGNSTTIGTFTLPFTGSATDQVFFVNLATNPGTAATGVDGSTVYSSDDGGYIRVNPGQELSITSDGGGDAGTYQVYAKYIGNGFHNEGSYVTGVRTFTRA